MNKKLLIFLTLFLLTNLFAFSQNWSPINASCKYHYYPDSGGYSKTVTIHADSVKTAGGDSVFYLNRIIARLSQWTFENSANQFLQGIVTKRSNGDAFFSDTVSFLIKTLASTGTSWLFDSLNTITAEVVLEDYIPVLGTNDSVKYIALTGADTIVISKNHGLIRFSVSGYAPVVYDLVGVEGMQAGMQIPGFAEYFNFNVGDVFEYQDIYSTGYGTGTWRNNGTKAHLRFTILTKNANNNGQFIYSAAMLKREITWQNNLPPQSTHYDTIYAQQQVTWYYKIIGFPDLNLDNYEANYADQYFDPMGAYDSGPLRMFLYEDNVFLAIGKGFFNPLGYGPATVKKQYAAGRGLVKHEEAHALNTNQSESRTYNLIGAIINGVTYGSIQTDSIYFKPQIVPVPELTVEVYPNPLRDELKIKTNNNDQLEIILYDILSKKILQQTFTGSASFNTEQLLPGTYIFEIKKNEGVVQRGKIVRE